MSYPTVFANLAGGVQPASLLDTMFNVAGNQGNIACTASGVTAITLTPNSNFFLPAAYVNYQMATFTAVGTSNGAVTLQIGALGLLKVFTAQGAQANNGDIANGVTYTVVFNSALDTGAGGWVLIGGGGAALLLGSSTNTPIPGGYLTMTSGVPIISADTTVSAGGNLFYTPFVSNSVPILTPTGVNWVSSKFAEMSLTMNAAHLASNIYDVFIAQAASGTLQIGTGPSWSAGGGSVTAGSCSRGTGAGSTALARINGLLVNNVTVTARNGASTFSIPAQTGLYVGSIFMDAVNGQVTNHRSIGQNRKWSTWNYFNRVPICLQVADPTATWSTAANFTWRASNAAAINQLATFQGVNEETIDLHFEQIVANTCTAGGTQSAVSQGIGINSVTAPSGMIGFISNAIAAGATTQLILTNRATATMQPGAAASLGFSLINSIEQVQSIGANNTVQFSGTSANMNFQATWRG